MSHPVYHTEKWRKVRAKVMARDPVCRLCRRKKSEDADHIVPLRSGGRPWDMANLQGLCKSCHRGKDSALQTGRKAFEPVCVHGYGSVTCPICKGEV